MSRLRKTGVCRDLSSLATRRVEVLVLGVLEAREVVDRIRNAGTDTFNSAAEVLQAVQGRLLGDYRTRVSLWSGP